MACTYISVCPAVHQLVVVERDVGSGQEQPEGWTSVSWTPEPRSHQSSLTTLLVQELSICCALLSSVHTWTHN